MPVYAIVQSVSVSTLRLWKFHLWLNQKEFRFVRSFVKRIRKRSELWFLSGWHFRFAYGDNQMIHFLGFHFGVNGFTFDRNLTPRRTQLMNILDSLIAEKPCKFDINQNNNNNQKKNSLTSHIEGKRSSSFINWSKHRCTRKLSPWNDVVQLKSCTSFSLSLTKLKCTVAFNVCARGAPVF